MRLIDADVLKEDLTRFYDGEVVARRLIDEQPTVDAVEVVRCRECKHYEWTANRVPEEQTWWCYKHNTEMGNNDFCSYGERKDGVVHENH